MPGRRVFDRVRNVGPGGFLSPGSLCERPEKIVIGSLVRVFEKERKETIQIA